MSKPGNRTAEQIVKEVIAAGIFTPKMSVIQELIEAKRQKDQQDRMLATADKIITVLNDTESELQMAVRELRLLRKQEAEKLDHIKNLDAKIDRINEGKFADVPELAYLVTETV
jgi:dsDNA-binding SOS-regulon protein